jgi:hypothetical protein
VAFCMRRLKVLTTRKFAHFVTNNDSDNSVIFRLCIFFWRVWFPCISEKGGYGIMYV